MVGTSANRNSVGSYLNLDPIDRVFLLLDDLNIRDARGFKASLPKLRYTRVKKVFDVLYPAFIESRMKTVDINDRHAWVVRHLGPFLEPVMARLKELR